MAPSFVSVEWLARFETNMRFLANETAISVSEILWWDKAGAKLIPSTAAEEFFAWYLRTAVIEGAGGGGNIVFRPMQMIQTSFKNEYANAGLELDRAQLLDMKGGILGGEAIAAGSEWITQVTEQAAYWPQRKIAALIVCGAAAANLAYDSLPFWSASHLLNPKNSAIGTFKNVFTGGASGTYPGACPIDNSVSVEVALQNLGKALAYIRSIPDPTNTMPRYLKPVRLVVPSALIARATQITDAKFIAQTAGSGGGAADVAAVMAKFGVPFPVEAPEIGAGYTYKDMAGNDVTGSDTNYVIVCKQAETSRLGGLTYVEREKFGISFYTGDGGGGPDMAELNRRQKYQWVCQGRNGYGYGHPDSMFLGKAA
jgi:hypothetical protein